MLGWLLGVAVGVPLLVLLAGIVQGLVLQAQSEGAQHERLETLPAAPEPDWTDPAIDPGISEGTPLDELQLIATHNSYVLEPNAFQLFLVDLFEPGTAATLRYSHPDLTTQLDAGIRSIELDPRDHGDRFTSTHVPLVANRGTAPDFGLALRELRIWSERHPGHVPIFVHIDLKQDYRFLDPTTRAWDEDSFERFDALVASELGGKVFTPGEYESAGGWPSLGDARGRFVLYFDNNTEATKILGFGSEQAFVASQDLDTAVAVFNDPSDPRIDQAADAGILVRTRADADLDIDPAVRDAALASRANLISTDFPASERRSDGYAVEFDGGWTVRARQRE